MNRAHAPERLEARRLLSAVADVDFALQDHGGHEHGGACACGCCGGSALSAELELAELPSSLLERATRADGDFIGDGHDHGPMLSDEFGTFYFDPAPLAYVDEEPAAAALAMPVAAVSSLPVQPGFSSNPSSPKKIFLDFDGHVVSNTAWNNLNNGNPIRAQPFDNDGNLFSFSNSEQSFIRETFAAVAEDFAPFNVDVTTIDPGASAFAGNRNAVRVLISTDRDSTALGGTGNQWFSNAGGVAYVNSWRFNGDTPVWVFENNLANNAKWIGEAVSHEVGHAFGLRHDGGGGDGEYFRGHGNWAPIMGVGYYRSVTQWSRGEYSGANNLEDDIAIIAGSTNGVGYRTDDHGDFISGASPVVVQSNSSTSQVLSADGIISRRSDVDVFRLDLTAGSGRVTGRITADGLGAQNEPSDANLNVKAALYTASGALVSSSFDAAGVPPLSDYLDSGQLDAGIYYLAVDGFGDGNPATTGYSDYGSLGEFRFNLTYSFQPDQQGELDVQVNGQTRSADLSGLQSTFSQDNGSFEGTTDGSGLTLVGNAWKHLLFDYDVTANTVLSFDVTTTSGAEIVAIGFDENRTFNDRARVFQVAGSQTFGQAADVIANQPTGTTRSYTVRVGDYYQGSMNYLSFVSDDDANSGARTTFRNLRINEAAAPPPVTPFAESNGLAVVEAAQPTGRGNSAGHEWVTRSGNGSSNGYLSAEPNTGFNSGDSLSGRRADYAIDFNTTGTYYVWLRMAGDSFRDDSVHVGLDGNVATIGGFGMSPPAGADASFQWVNAPAELGRRVTVNVTTPGVHTLNVWVREDGVRVDDIRLAKNASYNPAGPTTPPPPPGQPRFVVQNGLVAMQAEDFTGGSGSRGGDTWVEARYGNRDVMVAGPDDGSNAKDTTNGPRLDYAIEFDQPGTYYAWVRLADASGNQRSDSVHVGLNGTAATFGNWGLENPLSSLEWSNSGRGIGRVTVNVPSAGIHTFNLWMREDGTPVDKLVLTRDSGYVPTGLGPNSDAPTSGAAVIVSRQISIFGDDEEAPSRIAVDTL